MILFDENVIFQNKFQFIWKERKLQSGEIAMVCRRLFFKLETGSKTWLHNKLKQSII